MKKNVLTGLLFVMLCLLLIMPTTTAETREGVIALEGMEETVEETLFESTFGFSFWYASETLEAYPGEVDSIEGVVVAALYSDDYMVLSMISKEEAEDYIKEYDLTTAEQSAETRAQMDLYREQKEKQIVFCTLIMENGQYVRAVGQYSLEAAEGNAKFFQRVLDSVTIPAGQENSVQSIVGIWYEAEVLDSRTLTINADATYSLAYRGGGTAYGTVEVTHEEHPDGSLSPWYTFYEVDGAVWTSFPMDTSTAPTDLWSEQDGAMHFIRDMSEEYHGSGQGVKSEDYEGIWGCGRCTVVISREADDNFLATVTWASSAADGSQWTYVCAYDEYAAVLVCNSVGTRTDYAFTEDGSEVISEVYNDGSCDFVMREGVLRWIDHKENAGSLMEFIQ